MEQTRTHFLFLGIIVGGIFLALGDDASPNEPCTNLDHLTDPGFTCCVFKRYKAPSIYDKDRVAKCCETVATSERNETKIVKSAWRVFECLVGSGKEFSSAEFRTKMLQPFPDDIKELIKKQLIRLDTGLYNPYNGSTQLGELENLANMWNIYYTAESLACRKQAALERPKESQQNFTIEDLELTCFNWMERTMRRGDCCNGVSIPFQIHTDPIVIQHYALKNYTANNLMTLLGSDYNWKNTSIVMYSDAISSCSKTTQLILQGKITLESLVKQTKEQLEPQYPNITEMLIPTFFPTSVRTFFSDEMLKVDNGTQTGLQWDYMMTRMKRNESVSEFAYPGEWQGKKYDENATRILLWTCRAHALLDQLYKNVDYTEHCF